MLQCAKIADLQNTEGTASTTTVCSLHVDTRTRVEVVAFRWHLGIPFVGCCALGALFGLVAYQGNAHHISSDTLFVRESYTPVNTMARGHDDEHGGGVSLYSWELLWWAYVWILHIILVSCLTSPVDIFDTALVVGFGCLGLMYLCKPRNGSGRGDDEEAVDGKVGHLQLVVTATLVLCVWIAATSIPHAYEPDRMWLLGLLLGMDALMLFIHLSDSVPTMYTVLMGRLTYTILSNCALGYAYWVLPDRLEER